VKIPGWISPDSLGRKQYISQRAITLEKVGKREKGLETTKVFGKRSNCRPVLLFKEKRQEETENSTVTKKKIKKQTHKLMKELR